MLIGLNQFYEYMPSARNNIEISGTAQEAEFKTYGQVTKINLKDKKLLNFSPSAFDNHFELFKAASLTNYIQDKCKDKVATKEGGPFDKNLK